MPGCVSTATGRSSRRGRWMKNWPQGTSSRAAARDPDRHQGHHRRRRAAHGCGFGPWRDRVAAEDAGLVASLRDGGGGDPGQDGHDPVRLDRPAVDAQPRGTSNGRRAVRRAARRRPSPAGCAWGRSAPRRAARSSGPPRSAASPGSSRHSDVVSAKGSSRSPPASTTPGRSPGPSRDLGLIFMEFYPARRGDAPLIPAMPRSRPNWPPTFERTAPTAPAWPASRAVRGPGRSGRSVRRSIGRWPRWRRPGPR